VAHKDPRLSQSKWHGQGITVADGFAEGVAGGSETPAPDGGEGGVVEKGVSAGFGDANGGDVSGGSDGKGKGHGALLACAAGGGGVFGFGLVDAGGFAYDLFACSGASGSGFLGGEPLAPLFFDTLSGDFSFLGCFDLSLFLCEGGIWLGWFGLGFRFCKGSQLRNGFRLWGGRFLRRDDGWCWPGSRVRLWFLDFYESQVDELGLLNRRFGKVNCDSSPLQSTRKESRREKGDESPDQGLATL